MNWGKGVLIIFLAFAGLIFTLVYKSSNTKVELVSKDYYEEELLYQNKIDGMKNVESLNGKLMLLQDEKNVILQMPEEMKGTDLAGEVLFYFPPDATKDRKMPLKVDGSGKQEFGKTQLSKGSYTVKVSWQSGVRKFYTAQLLKID